MNSIDEKNNEILACALSKAAKDNNRDFPDDIKDDITLKLIKKLAEFEISKIEFDFSFESDFSIFISILGIIFAFVGIGLSDITLGISLTKDIKDISSFSWYYINLGIIIIFFGIVFSGLALYVYNRKYKEKDREKRERINYFQYVILKIERRVS